MGTGCVRSRSSTKKEDHKQPPNLRLTGKILREKLSENNTDEKVDEPTDAPFAIIEDRAKTKEDIDFLKASLSKNLIFNELSEEQLDSVIRHMRYYIFESQEVVFVQGSAGSVFFVVANGKLEVIVDGKVVNELTTSDCFGEVALLHDTNRTATIKTVFESKLWGVDRKTFRSTLEHLNANDYEENKNLIMNIPSFKILSHIQLESLINSVSISVYGPGQVIVTQGEIGSLLYIIKQGSVICTENGRQTRILEKGEYFGEKALFSQNSLRSATVTATEYVKCLTISRDTLTDLLGSSIQRLVYKNSARIAFDRNFYLQKLCKTQYEKILNFLEIVQKKKNEKIIEAGTVKKNQIFVVVKGELADCDGQVWFREGDVLCIEEIIQEMDSCFLIDYYCNGDVDLGVIRADRFFEVVDGDYDKATQNNETIKVLKNIEIFKHLTEEQFESMARVLKMTTYAKDSIIFSQNDRGDSMYLIKSGQVDIIVNDHVVRTIRNNNFFGERALLTGNIRSATSKCKTEVSCWILYTEDFNKLFDSKLKELLRKRIELQDDKISLDQLQIVKQIGSGTYGNVFLVVHKTQKTLFALKTVSRRKIQAYEIHENLLRERRIMLQIDHMLIVKLVKTFKDANRLYFLCEYISGVTLREVQDKFKKFSSADVKFYSACIFLMLEHLHERGILYRGLNPGNLILDSEGYPKLIDFGSAKIVQGRTYTIVDTAHHYLAPEIILSHGYNLSADYWSAGVLLFELLYGELPFGEEENDPYSIYESILKGKFSFPEESVNIDKVKDLISQLLNKNSGLRLNGGFSAIYSHPWFISINWEKLTRKSLPTSYKPLLKNLEKEVELLSKSKKELLDVISRVEKNEVVRKERSYEKVSPNWDDEFST